MAQKSTSTSTTIPSAAIAAASRPIALKGEGEEGGNTARSFDLTQTLASHLDRHLVFPLLEFLQAREIYPEEDILAAKLDMLGRTGMIDFAVDIHKRLNHTEEVPSELKEKRQVVVASLKKLQAEVAPLLAVLDDAEVLNKLVEDNVFTAPYLEEKYGVTASTIDSLYKFAKFQYDCGNYSGAAAYLDSFRTLTDSPSSERARNALWGKFAADILMQNWDSALEDMYELGDMIDSLAMQASASSSTGSVSVSVSKLEILHHRAWLIHWSLFVFFNHPNGRNGIIDFFLADKYLNTIQLTCPHILRYLATAVITSKRRRTVMRTLVAVIQQEEYEYTDPITELLNCVFVQFDFDAAMEKLKECEAMLSNDFFLVACQEEFVENARLVIFETFCTIHKKVDIGTLAEKLDMDLDEAEKWVLSLVHDARMKAKVTLEDNQVVMVNVFDDVYEQVKAKTKSLPLNVALSAPKEGAEGEGEGDDYEGEGEDEVDEEAADAPAEKD